MCERSFVHESSYNISIIVALVALIGTLIGATIGAATNYILAVRRERSERAEEKRKNDIEVKRAARLIFTDFLSAISVMELTVSDGKWNLTPLSTESWQKYSPVLAPEFSDDDWFKVSTASLAVDNFIDVRKGAIQGDTAQFPLGDGVEKIKAIQDDVKAGLKVLNKWHTDKH